VGGGLFGAPVPKLMRPLVPLGFLRRRRNIRDMGKTLARIKDVVEAG
jgi:hypothetical protein